MGGRPRSDGTKPPSAEGSTPSAKRSKAKAPADAAADAPPRAKAKAKPAPAAVETPSKTKAKAKAKSADAPAPTAPRKARAKGAAAVQAPIDDDAAEPSVEIAIGALRKPKGRPGGDAMALLDALRRAQGKPVSAPALGEDADEAETADDDVDAEADGDAVKPEIVRVPKAPPPFARTSGAPALGFPADKRPAPRWDFAVGKPLTLPLGVRSTGGVGRGVIVELSGAAIAEGLFEASELVHDGTRAHFARDAATGVLRATLTDSAIPIGVQVPLSPPPRDEMQRYAARSLLASTHIELSIEGQGARVGTALLSVAARPATGTAAPLKWTRPITFR